MLFTVLLEENMDRNPEFDYGHFELTDIDIEPWKQSKLHLKKKKHDLLVLAEAECISLKDPDVPRDKKKKKTKYSTKTVRFHCLYNW